MDQTTVEEVIIPDQITTDLRQPRTQPTRLRELCPAPALRLLLPENVHQVTTGCRQTQDKADGAWLTAEHMWAVADIMAVVEALIRPILARQGHPGQVILTRVCQATHASQAATIIIIILPVHTSTVALQAITGMVVSV